MTKDTINICRLQLLEVLEDIGGMSTLLREALEFPDEHQESIDATCDEVRTVAEETITDGSQLDSNQTQHMKTIKYTERAYIALWLATLAAMLWLLAVRS